LRSAIDTRAPLTPALLADWPGSIRAPLAASR